MPHLGIPKFLTDKDTVFVSSKTKAVARVRVSAYTLVKHINREFISYLA